ncbi:MAG: hypothetical protein AAF211_29190, partial [Myxococcota bacterium]
MLVANSRAYLTAGPYRVGDSDTLDFGAAPGGPAVVVDFTRYERDDGPPLLVWVEPEPRPASPAMTPEQTRFYASVDDQVVAAFETRMQAAGPAASGVYLVPGRTGLSSMLSRAKTALGSADGTRDGGLRVPVQFFDAEYQYDGNDQVLSALKNIRNDARRLRRVAQPFTIDGKPSGAPDLVAHVVASLGKRPTASRLRIIDGDAGGGKTVAFNAITEQAYRGFRQAKRELGFGLRPIAFNETHLRATNRDERSRVDNLIEAVIHIELAQLVPREQFVWLLQNGYTTWLFDGLDEIYGGDPHFFRTIGELLDAPGSCAQILISTRDSLFRTSRYLRDFLSESRAIGRNVELLELSPWSEDAWRQMAWIHLEHEREGAQDSARIQGFVDRIRGSEALRSLARLPFYCDELVDMDGAFGSESDVLATIVGRMLEREWNKNVVDWRSY